MTNRNDTIKDLALMGFGNIDVIDMDTIDVSNLNLQFPFHKGQGGRRQAKGHRRRRVCL